MKRKKLLLIALLLTAVTQGAWAQEPESTINVTDSNNGSITVTVSNETVTKAKEGAEVTLTANPNNDYVLTQIEVLDANNNYINVKWNVFTETATFTMPASEVTITPTFTNTPQDLYVNMPANGTMTVNIPETVLSFKVYDDGGPHEKYSQTGNSTLTLTAPDGYLFLMSGSLDINYFDKLTIYDGSDNTAATLLKDVNSNINIYNLLSSGNSITFNLLRSNSISPADGLDLTVKLINTNTDFNIGLNDNVAAKVGDASKTTAKVNELVTLNITPPDGSVLSELSVVDSDNNPVNVNWDLWANTATFIMPPSAVTVTTTFVSINNTDFYINIPTTGTQYAVFPLGVQSVKIYDDGGASGTHSLNCDGTLVITAPEGYLLKLSGSFWLDNSQEDVLNVYDGNSSNADKLIDNARNYHNSGTKADIPTVVSSGQCMTICLHTDNYGQFDGLDLSLTLVDANTFYNIQASDNIQNGSIAFTVDNTDATQAKAYNVVTMTASPAQEYLLSEVSVVPADNTMNAPIINHPIWSNQATFTMPASAVTVTPTFIPKADAFINMPATGEETVDIPANIQSFKLYDTGGANGDYNRSCNGILTLTAPQGYRLELSGSITTDASGDYLTVYDGSDAQANTLLYEVKSSNSGTQTRIRTVFSSGSTITVCFYADDSNNNYAGLDLTVKVFNANQTLTINGLDNTTGGSLAATIGGQPATQPEAGQIVTLTATPSDGHVLSSISIVDADNNVVDIDWDIWTNTATFTMPGSDVTIKSTFTDNLTGLYLNMPSEGTKKTVIPAGVRSFKIYDDGGSAGNYSHNSNGYLIITAPDNYRLLLSGNITTEPNDKLTVYDGNDVTADKLLDAVTGNGNYYQATPKAIATASSGRYMLLYFNSNQANNYDGLDLTVTAYNPDASYTINGIGEVNGGRIVASVGEVTVNSAKYNQEVLLTVNPDEDYVVNGISVRDDDGNEVEVSWDQWANTATFTMPPSTEVTVNAILTANNGYYVNMPVTGTKTITIPTGASFIKVYDDGGPNGNYSSNCEGYLVLTAPDGYTLELSGTYLAQPNYDFMYVYDGSDRINDQKLASVSYEAGSNTPQPIPTVLSSGQIIMLYFHSDNSVQNEGFDLTVKVGHKITVTSLEYGTVNSDKYFASDGETVTLNATPSNDYALTDISVTDGSNNAVVADWDIWSNQATFTMPTSAVSVNPTFTGKNSLSVNIPATGSKTAIIPTGVSSFKVYDDGGSNGNYQDGSQGTLILTAPQGMVMQLSGGIATQENNDYLTVYDGGSTDATMLIESESGTGIISAVISSGQSMTLCFHSDNGTSFDGLDLTVQLGYLTTVSQQEHGSIIADKQFAIPEEAVTLNATPSEGYLLTGITVVDGNNNTVAVEQEIWANQATFNMPASSVTITPIFTSKNSLSVDMPVSGSRTVVIPAGVPSFKVYDNGGLNGNYNDNCNGSLILTAPYGYTLQLSGSIYTQTDYDKLTVYDNNQPDGTKLIDAMSSSSNDNTAIPVVSSSGQSMTLSFISNELFNYAGLDLTVKVFDPNESFNIYGLDNTTGGSLSAAVGDLIDVTKAKPNDVVTLTATLTGNYVLTDLSVVDAENNPVNVTRELWANSATFTMPTSDVTVTTTFSNDPNDLYINMNQTGESAIIIPAHITSFKVYDNGGPDNGYSSTCNGTLTLTAPEGYTLQLSGSVKLNSGGDYLEVYNGASTSCGLLSKVTSSYKGQENQISVSSTGQSMTLYFYSYNSVADAGLDLTVTVYNPNAEYAISGLGDVSNCNIVASVDNKNVEQAKENDVVTLTVTPGNGYVLTDLTVVDADNHAVTVNRGPWDNIATFTMPASTVTVSTTLTDNPADLYINMPTSDTRTVNIPVNVQSFKVYDDGGPEGYYSSNCNGYLILNAPDGYLLKLTGSINTEVRDKLTIYDNNEASGTKLINELSSTNTISDIMSSGNSLTLFFQSDYSVEYNGLDLTVTVLNPNAEYPISGLGETSNCNIIASVDNKNVDQAKKNDVVTLTVTPKNGYVLTDLTVVDAANHAVTVNRGLWDNTATFIMPASAVTVTPTFANPEDLYINMPESGTSMTINIPVHVQSFKVYDDGGKDYSYSDNYNGTLTLTAPDGYLIQLSGNIRTESNCDKLTVYDNNQASGTTLINMLSSSSLSDIPTVVSSGQSMTLKFESDGSSCYDGLNLTVTLINPNTGHTISVLDADAHGCLVVTVDEKEETEAKYNDVVTLTSVPDDGYTLIDVSVKDANKNDVDVDWNKITLTASFKMPASAVTVTPTFTDNPSNLYVNIPATGSKTVGIPTVINSIKVYDDGGPEANYSNNCNGTLTLIAPENCQLQLSGSIASEYYYDYLKVYDGNDNTAGVLIERKYGQDDNTPLDINPVVTSSGRSMTLWFYSNNSTNYSGLDLTVRVMINTIELTDNISDVAAALSPAGQTCKVTYSRSFTAGTLSTICLPFAMTSISGGKVYSFVDVTYDKDDGWVATMQDTSPDGNLVNATTANTPYLFLPDADGNITFSGTIDNVPESIEAGTSTSGDWTFHGTYSPLGYETEKSESNPFSGTVFGFAATNGKATDGLTNVAAGQFVKAGNGASIPPFRAFLTYSGVNSALHALYRGTKGTNATNIPDRITVRLIGKDGMTTAVGTMDIDNGNITIERWYDMKGQLIDGTPATPGLYLNSNGKKVLISE